MDLVVDPRGRISCVYDEAIDLTALGAVTIASRASHVERRRLPAAGRRPGAPSARAGGWASFPFRSEALAAERAWLSRPISWPTPA